MEVNLKVLNVFIEESEEKLTGKERPNFLINKNLCFPQAFLSIVLFTTCMYENEKINK